MTVLAVSLGTLLLTALSTGSPIFLMAAILLVVILVLSLVSVLWAAKTTQIHCLLSGQSVRRGDTVSLTIQVQCGCPLPIAPILLELAATPDTPETQLRMTNLRGRGQTVTLPFHAVHVGVTSPGVNRYVVEDLFGLFSISREPDIRSREMLVLPMTFEVDELKFSSGDAGSEIMHKATEDINAPADVRSYQPGDPLKKIHWKLSLRKNELMVRRFEEPVLPDALVLMDWRTGCWKLPMPWNLKKPWACPRCWSSWPGWTFRKQTALSGCSCWKPAACAKPAARSLLPHGLTVTLWTLSSVCAAWAPMYGCT